MERFEWKGVEGHRSVGLDRTFFSINESLLIYIFELCEGKRNDSFGFREIECSNNVRFILCGRVASNASIITPNRLSVRVQYPKLKLHMCSTVQYSIGTVTGVQYNRMR